MRMRTKTTGKKYRFTYPNYGTPDTHPDYTKHSGQRVTILGLVPRHTYNDGNGNMYYVRADDGWKGQAFGSELRTK